MTHGFADVIAALESPAANDAAAPLGDGGARNAPLDVFAPADDRRRDGTRGARLLHDLDPLLRRLFPRAGALELRYNLNGDVVVAKSSAEMIAIRQRFVTNEEARRTFSCVAAMRLSARMMAVGRQSAGLDAARRNRRSRPIAARKRHHREPAKTLYILGYCAGIAPSDVASANALVLATGQSSPADVVARRTISVATLALALMAPAVFHTLALVLAVEFCLVGTLEFFPMSTAPAFTLGGLTAGGAGPGVAALVAMMLSTFQQFFTSVPATGNIRRARNVRNLLLAARTRSPVGERTRAAVIAVVADAFADVTAAGEGFAANVAAVEGRIGAGSQRLFASAPTPPQRLFVARRTGAGVTRQLARMLGAIQRFAAQFAATPITTAATKQLGGCVAAVANVFDRLRARRARTRMAKKKAIVSAAWR